MVLIYPPYPAPFSIEKYFMKRGFESAVSEFELVRKILYVAIPLLIFFTVIDLLRPLFEQFVSDEIVSMLTNNIVFYSAKGFLFLTVLAGLLKMVFALSRKRFRLYFVVLRCRISSSTRSLLSPIINAIFATGSSCPIRWRRLRL